jgi:putative nucleotidyltransferase with HDIG domain
MSLYEEHHPSRERALDGAYEALLRLQEEHPEPEFTFLGDEILYQRRPLLELRTWDWGARLARGGIQWLRILGPVSRDEMDGFLHEVLARVNPTGTDTSEARQMRETNIRFGTVDLEGGGGKGEEEEKEAAASLAFTLREEADAVRWLHEELQDRGDLHLVEAEAVVRSLSVAMHGHRSFLIPLLRLKRFDQYTTTHALNVSVLAMALAEFIGLGPREVRMFGIAGLLHDLGKVKVPEEILTKPGPLTDAEREVMNRHPVEGAKLILASERHLDLAAVVAYEHHIKINGGGYPRFTHPRKCHQASDLVHVCDVFDALRTSRPYREAWSTPKALSLIQRGAGKEFDPDLAHAFTQMIRRWETRIAELSDEDQAVSPEESGSRPDMDGRGDPKGSSEDTVDGDDGRGMDEDEPSRGG